VCSRFHGRIPLCMYVGHSPHSCRRLHAGGANLSFAETSNIEVVRWRGPCLPARKLVIYLQLTAALALLPPFQPSAATRVARFIAPALALVQAVASRMQGKQHWLLRQPCRKPSATLTSAPGKVDGARTMLLRSPMCSDTSPWVVLKSRPVVDARRRRPTVEDS